MNIFVLDKEPVLAARYHCDKHVVKMTLETAQILSTVSGLGGYKPTHQNHPCVKWARAGLMNYIWLTELGIALGKEYTYRYGKYHKSAEVIHKCALYGNFENKGGTPFVQCMPLHCIRYKDPIEGYRTYYVREKAHMCTWKRREVPQWFTEKLNDSN